MADASDKEQTYRELLAEVKATLEGEDDLLTRMSTVCALIHHRLEYTSWVGFYRVVSEGMLAAGPYQGGLGCLRIPFDRGVCGAAARTGETQLVPDVHAFPGHIACDDAAKSEIVVPVRDRSGRLLAVLDLDSRQIAAFDQTDRLYLEKMTALLTGI